MTSLFVTGASGFIGRRLARNLNPADYDTIYFLNRTECDDLSFLRNYDNVQFVRGSLFDGEIYLPYLAKSDIVIHLAAITGKAKNEEYFNVNANGTDFLLEQCAKSNVSSFLYVSSIAAKFSDIDNYPYAQSKLKAEQYVRESGIQYSILRPTIVIGENSPVLMSFLKLTKAPIVPIFGDGTAMIQPIFVEDLISCILHIIRMNTFENEIMEMGGPEQISIERFIKRLCLLSYNKTPRFIHVPNRPIMKILRFMESFLFSFLPITAGQLVSFSSDGTIASNRLFNRYRNDMKRVDEMLRFALHPVNDTIKTIQLLEKEYKKFDEYLVKGQSNAYVKDKYIEGHKLNKIENGVNNFDILLIKAAHSNKFILKLADIYTSVFYRKAVLRKKLVLLLAILESCSATYSKIDTVNEDSKISLFINLAQKSFVFAVLLIVSVAIFLPIQAAFNIPFLSQIISIKR